MLMKNILLTAALIVFGACAGWVATWLHLPMPWMIGSLLASAIAVALFQNNVLQDFKFSQPFRNSFVALIGVMIGTQVTPELASILPELPLTIAALALFVVLAHFGNHLIFRKIGGFDRATAFYSGAPGGLMESILFGEQAGADVRVLTMQQFLRIILVITLLPLGISLWLGTPVGSAAGAATEVVTKPLSLLQFGQIALVGAVGLAIARFIHLPASQLIGPLLLSAVLALTGVIDLHLPFWLIATAQVVIGSSLGLRFAGITFKMLRRSIALSFVSVGYMLVIGSLLAAALHAYNGQSFLTLFISFAPGGVTEMSLVALSLAASPAIVSLHHVLRIMLTVFELTVASKKLGLRD